MIKIDFNPPDSIPGSILLRAEDLNDPSGLAVKLRDNNLDPLSPFLRGALSAGTLQQLQAYDATQPLPYQLRDAIISEINQALQGSTLYDKRRFRGVAWGEDRQTLMPKLIKLAPAGDGLVCLNRLLIEEVYSDEIAASPKAEWNGWILLAEAAKKEVIERWEAHKEELAAWKNNGKQGDAPTFDPKLDEDLWRSFRNWLKTHVFNNKCAYCETKLVGNPGDTEHFRPKGRVSILRADGTTEVVKVVDEDGEETTHPGYFWLAYHWQNLLPSCKYCNSGVAKNDLFPVKKSHVAVKKFKGKEIDDLLDKITQSMKAADIYYLEPRDLDRLEDRLLLHPYYDQPYDHIYFDRGGEAHEWCDSELGKQSIKVYDLNERTKKEARAEAQEVAKKIYFLLMGGTPDDKIKVKQAAQAFFNDYDHGKMPYYAAVFDYLHELFENSPYDPARIFDKHRPKR